MEWIKTSEKLPEDGQRVLIMCECVNPAYVDMVIFGDSHRYGLGYVWIHRSHFIYCQANAKIIPKFWMPLPESKYE